MAALTITYPDALQPVLTEAIARYGSTVVAILVTDWLNDRKRTMADADITEIRTGTASERVKARVRTELGF